MRGQGTGTAHPLANQHCSVHVQLIAIRWPAQISLEANNTTHMILPYSSLLLLQASKEIIQQVNSLRLHIRAMHKVY